MTCKILKATLSYDSEIHEYSNQAFEVDKDKNICKEINAHANINLLTTLTEHYIILMFSCDLNEKLS